MDKDLWLECKNNGVTAIDIEREWNRFQSVGLSVKQEVAAAAALRYKKSKGLYF